MTVPELQHRYLQALQVRGLNVGTLGHYRRILTRFASFLGERPIAEVNEELLGSYKAWLQSRAPSKGWLYDEFSTLRIVLRWAVAQGFLLTDPGSDFRERAPQYRARFVPNQAQVLALLALPNAGLTGQRDRAVLGLLYGTGLRRLEGCRLNLGDYQRELGLWVRQGKGRKDRLVPVGPYLDSVLSHYLDQVRPALNPPVGETALLVTRRGTRMSVESVTAIVKLYGRKLGLKRLCPHSLRHAYASHLLEGGATLQHVQLLLGHSLIQTTQTYTRLQPLDLLREYRRCHPRARRRAR
jgi:site-specific recombinase XerD